MQVLSSAQSFSYYLYHLRPDKQSITGVRFCQQKKTEGDVLLILARATPMALWARWPFFQRGWASIINHRLNMVTQIAFGTGSRTSTVLWPRSSRNNSLVILNPRWRGRHLLRCLVDDHDVCAVFRVRTVAYPDDCQCCQERQLSFGHWRRAALAQGRTIG